MIISHDLGTTGDKATLVSNTGEVVASVTERYDTAFGPGGKAEQNPSDWWRAFCQANRTLIERANITASDVDVVSFSGQMMGLVAIDGAGEIVRPAIIWADTRSTAQTNQALTRVSMERTYEITGHRLNPTYSLTKLMWVRDNEPEAFARIRTVLNAKDYLAYLLTGVLASEPSDASSTNAYDQSTGNWSPEMLAAAEVDPALFPEIVPSTTVLGAVTAAAADASGLLAGTKVVIGGGDGPLAALGAGITNPESGAYASLGSSSWVSVSAPQPLHDPLMRSMTFNHVIPGQFVPTATMQAGGASLQWIVDTLAPTGEARYEDLLGEAAKVSASGAGVFFLPHLLGERSPYWNPNARAAFLGLERHHGRSELVRAVLEGVAFNLRTGLLAFTSNGIKIDSIDVIGGAANSPLVLNILANIWDLPASRRSLVDEANALGAAIVGGIGVGIFDDFEISKTLSQQDAPQLPDPAASAELDRSYELFMDAYQRLEGWFEALP
ncbi:MAG: xylulokinase [Leucobacter sp.]